MGLSCHTNVNIRPLYLSNPRSCDKIFAKTTNKITRKLSPGVAIGSLGSGSCNFWFFFVSGWCALRLSRSGRAHKSTTTHLAPCQTPSRQLTRASLRALSSRKWGTDTCFEVEAAQTGCFDVGSGPNKAYIDKICFVFLSAPCLAMNQVESNMHQIVVTICVAFAPPLPKGN